MSNKENASPNNRAKGLRISLETKEIIHYMNNDLKSMGKKRKEIISAIRKATRVSKASIYRILNEKSLTSTKTSRRSPTFKITEDDITAIDEHISEYFNENKIPSRYDIYKKMKSGVSDSISFKKCGTTTFYKLLKKAGYKAKLTVKLARELKIQETQIRKQRIDYLRRKKELEDQKYEFVYLDETYIHKNYMKTRIVWPLKKNLRIKLKMAKGDRYSVIYAGGHNGFIGGSLLVHKNSELNSEKFEKWMETQLLPNLKKPSVIVFDNARTHSRILNKRPNCNSLKAEMKEWLILNGIESKQIENLNKKQLYAEIKKFDNNRSYAVDQIIRAAGHVPLRTPPYCCEVVFSYFLCELIHFSPSSIQLNSFGLSGKE